MCVCVWTYHRKLLAKQSLQGFLSPNARTQSAQRGRSEGYQEAEIQQVRLKHPSLLPLTLVTRVI